MAIAGQGKEEDAMLIADKVMEAFSRSPDRPLTIPDLARMLGASVQHVRTGVMVLLASGHIAASGTRKGHGRSAVEYSIRAR
jgi:predicted ArsR family transcriptional regulator